MPIKPIIPEDAPPAELLDAEPVIESLDEVEVALRELAWINGREATCVKACEAKINLFKAQCQAELVIQVGRTQFTFADRRAALQAEIERWCTEHKDEVLADGTKTRKFTHGQVSFTAEGEKVVVVDSTAAATDKVVDKLGLADALRKVLDKLKLFDQPADQFVELNPKLRLTSIKTLYKDQKVGKGQLRQIGLMTTEPAERFALKSAECLVRSETAVSIAD